MPAYPLGTTHPEYAKRHNLPFEASQGGAQTMYPEYMKRLEELRKAASPAALGHPTSSPGPHPVKPAYDDGAVEVIPVQGNVHLVAGSGANITVQVDPTVCSSWTRASAAMSEKVIAAIRTISDKADSPDHQHEC